MKSGYGVTIPIAGAICVSVEAGSPEEAKRIAMGAGWSMDIELVELNGSIIGVDIVEVDQHERISSGNILHVPYNDVEVEEY